jgi:hypothetical protein
VRHKTAYDPGRDFEADYDPNAHSYRGRGDSATPGVMESADLDFIPFTRTTDILDPARADAPLQLSRENSRVTQARTHYQHNQRPAQYGTSLQTRKVSALSTPHP